MDQNLYNQIVSDYNVHSLAAKKALVIKRWAAIVPLLNKDSPAGVEARKEAYNLKDYANAYDFMPSTGEASGGETLNPFREDGRLKTDAVSKRYNAQVNTLNTLKEENVLNVEKAEKANIRASYISGFAKGMTSTIPLVPTLDLDKMNQAGGLYGRIGGGGIGDAESSNLGEMAGMIAGTVLSMGVGAGGAGGIGSTLARSENGLKSTLGKTRNLPDVLGGIAGKVAPAFKPTEILSKNLRSQKVGAAVNQGLESLHNLRNTMTGRTQIAGTLNNLNKSLNNARLLDLPGSAARGNIIAAKLGSIGMSGKSAENLASGIHAAGEGLLGSTAFMMGMPLKNVLGNAIGTNPTPNYDFAKDFGESWDTSLRMAIPTVVSGGLAPYTGRAIGKVTNNPVAVGALTGMFHGVGNAAIDIAAQGGLHNPQSVAAQFGLGMLGGIHAGSAQRAMNVSKGLKPSGKVDPTNVFRSVSYPTDYAETTQVEKPQSTVDANRLGTEKYGGYIKPIIPTGDNVIYRDGQFVNKTTGEIIDTMAAPEATPRVETGEPRAPEVVQRNVETPTAVTEPAPASRPPWAGYEQLPERISNRAKQAAPRTVVDATETAPDTRPRMQNDDGTYTKYGENVRNANAGQRLWDGETGGRNSPMSVEEFAERFYHQDSSDITPGVVAHYKQLKWQYAQDHPKPTLPPFGDVEPGSMSVDAFAKSHGWNGTGQIPPDISALHKQLVTEYLNERTMTPGQVESAENPLTPTDNVVPVDPTLAPDYPRWEDGNYKHSADMSDAERAQFGTLHDDIVNEAARSTREEAGGDSPEPTIPTIEDNLQPEKPAVIGTGSDNEGTNGHRHKPAPVNDEAIYDKPSETPVDPTPPDHGVVVVARESGISPKGNKRITFTVEDRVTGEVLAPEVHQETSGSTDYKNPEVVAAIDDIKRFMHNEYMADNNMLPEGMTVDPITMRTYTIADVDVFQSGDMNKIEKWLNDYMPIPGSLMHMTRKLFGGGAAILDHNTQALLLKKLGSESRVAAYVYLNTESLRKTFTSMTQLEQARFMDMVNGAIPMDGIGQLTKAQVDHARLQSKLTTDLTLHEQTNSSNRILNSFRKQYFPIRYKIAPGSTAALERVRLGRTDGIMDYASSVSLQTSRGASGISTTNKRAFVGEEGFTKQRTNELTVEESLRQGAVLMESNQADALLGHANDVMRSVSTNTMIVNGRRMGAIREWDIGVAMPAGFGKATEALLDGNKGSLPKLKDGKMWIVEANMNEVLKDITSPNSWLDTHKEDGSKNPYVGLGRSVYNMKMFYTKIMLGFSFFHYTTIMTEASGTRFGAGIQVIMNKSSLSMNERMKLGARYMATSIVPGMASGEFYMQGRLLQDLFKEVGSAPYVGQLATMKNTDTARHLESTFGLPFEEIYQHVQELTAVGMQPVATSIQKHALVETTEMFIANGSAVAQKINEGYQTSRNVFKGIDKVVSGMSSPLFEEFIPKIKQAATMHEYIQLLRQYDNPSNCRLMELVSDLPVSQRTLEGARARLAIKAVNTIDNRFGELSVKRLMQSPNMQTALVAFYTAYTWKLGNMRETGNAIKDIYTETHNATIGARRAGLSMRTPFIGTSTAWEIGMFPIQFVMSNVISKLMTGKFAWEYNDGKAFGGAIGLGAKLQRIIYNSIFPHNDPNDPSSRIQVPGGYRDQFSFVHDPIEYATAPNSLLAKTIDVMRNADVYNNAIVDDKDNPLVATAKRAWHMTPTPVTLGPIDTLRKGLEWQKAGLPLNSKKIAIDAGMNFIGFNKSRSFTTKEPWQDLQTNATKKYGFTKKDATQSADVEKRELRNAIIKYTQSGQVVPEDILNRLMENGQLSKQEARNTYKESQLEPGLQSFDNPNFPAEVMINIYLQAKKDRANRNDTDSQRLLEDMDDMVYKRLFGSPRKNSKGQVKADATLNGGILNHKNKDTNEEKQKAAAPAAYKAGFIDKETFDAIMNPEYQIERH